MKAVNVHGRKSVRKTSRQEGDADLPYAPANHLEGDSVAVFQALPSSLSGHPVTSVSYTHLTLPTTAEV